MGPVRLVGRGVGPGDAGRDNRGAGGALSCYRLRDDCGASAAQRQSAALGGGDQRHWPICAAVVPGRDDESVAQRPCGGDPARAGWVGLRQCAGAGARRGRLPGLGVPALSDGNACSRADTRGLRAGEPAARCAGCRRAVGHTGLGWDSGGGRRGNKETRRQGNKETRRSTPTQQSPCHPLTLSPCHRVTVSPLPAPSPAGPSVRPRSPAWTLAGGRGISWWPSSACCCACGWRRRG